MTNQFSWKYPVDLHRFPPTPKSSCYKSYTKGKRGIATPFSGNTSETGSYSVLFPKQTESNSFPKCPWRNKNKQVRTGRRGFRKQHPIAGGWPLMISQSSTSRSCGYFEVWDIHGSGWANGCSHPAFEKGRKQLGNVHFSHAVRREVHLL